MFFEPIFYQQADRTEGKERKKRNKNAFQVVDVGHEECLCFSFVVCLAVDAVFNYVFVLFDRQIAVDDLVFGQVHGVGRKRQSEYEDHRQNELNYLHL